MGNAFMNAAAKSRQQQTNIERTATDADELVCINLRIPKSMHQKILMHRVQTGENMTQLINRLLANELD